MKKIIILFVAIFIASSMGISQKLDWVKTVGGAGTDTGLSIAIDDSGNVYTTGYFEGTVDFDPNAGVSNMTARRDHDIFIQKLDVHGNLCWAKSMRSTRRNEGRAIAVDNQGNVYTTGSFGGRVDFDPNAGSAYLVSEGMTDIFIQKLDARGNFIWAESIGGVMHEESYAITTDDFGYVYVTGYFSDTVDFDTGIGTSILATGWTDIFVLKIDSAANFVWAKGMGEPTSLNIGKSIAVDDSGSVYTTGFFLGTVDFDPGPDTFNLTSAGYQDVFIQKLDAAGNLLWAQAIGERDLDRAVSIAVNFDSKSIYVFGEFRLTIDFDPGVGVDTFTSKGWSDMFILKLTSDGDYIWTKTIGSNFDERGQFLTLDALGNIYTTGKFWGTMDFDPGSSVYNLTGGGGFIQKLDSSGNFIWAGNMPPRVIGEAIVVDSLGSIYTTGTFEQKCDLDPGRDTLALTAIGGHDFFVQKLKACTIHSTVDVLTHCDSFTWIDGITYTSNNNAATHILSSATGCDSTITLDLTINNVDGSLTTVAQSITANATLASYQWLDCGNAYAVITGETQQTFTASVNGSYAVAVTQNGCTDTSQCITILTVDILENILFKNVSIFPNPSTGFVNIDLSDLKEASIKVFDINGQLIYQQENIKTPSHRFELKAAAGVYFVEVSAQGARQQYKLIKK